MSTYNLFPGLKQILEDKRIKAYGVPQEHFEKYLKAEQFVIDGRPCIAGSSCYSEKEITDISLTAKALSEIGLYKPPYSCFVVHELAESYAGTPFVLSYFFISDDACEYYESFFLSETKEGLSLMQSQEAIDEFKRESSWGIQTLVVMLATKGTIKERHKCKRSQAAIGSKPHKKGSAGYTIVRPPEAHELEGYIPDGSTKRPHFRRGHIRKLDPENREKWIWVSSCFIHGEPETTRKAYLVQP